ncbi:DUF4198 domain-containing protein [Dethiobacter alkaliphilus]|uniref:ABC-type Co2+ transport system periplasmic component-like protein n=1 Tax=Dethiobacter alkaliphilus AHT 1 TaxID=555088 RepID=C0GC70_DETAL|nr:DUF4198 domain-containing protein [Dethiobacter alkaliphilus]EEG78805.1 ABC-type Co2+ transport system periplasmic component-like protein [Dethiobacter alkaliphilus AHT 1]
MSRWLRCGLLAILMVFLLSGSLVAHEIILNVSQDGAVGEEATIEFTLGHFPDDYDYEHDFFQRFADGQLFVIDPDGDETELQFKRETDRYTATFTPLQEGLHWVVANIPRGVLDRTPDDGLQLRFYDAKTPLFVGEQYQGELSQTMLPVEMVGARLPLLQVNEEFAAQLHYDGEPIAGQTVLLVSPTEVAMEVTTDEDGSWSFTPIESGRWMIKTTLMDTTRQGEYQGEEYDRTRYNSALYLDVLEAGAMPVNTASDTINVYIIIALIVVLGGGAWLLFSARRKA